MAFKPQTFLKLEKIYESSRVGPSFRAWITVEVARDKMEN